MHRFTPDVVPFIFEFQPGPTVQHTVQTANVPVFRETPLVFVPSSVILVATLDSTTATQDAPISVTAVTANGVDVRRAPAYQWQVLNGTNWTDISGATHATYAPAEADEGKALRLVVSLYGREHDGFGRGDSGESGRRPCGDARWIDRRQCGRGRGRQRHGGDGRRSRRSSVEHYLLPVADSSTARPGPTFPARRTRPTRRPRPTRARNCAWW